LFNPAGSELSSQSGDFILDLFQSAQDDSERERGVDLVRQVLSAGVSLLLVPGESATATGTSGDGGSAAGSSGNGGSGDCGSGNGGSGTGSGSGTGGSGSGSGSGVATAEERRQTDAAVLALPAALRVPRTPGEAARLAVQRVLAVRGLHALLRVGLAEQPAATVADTAAAEAAEADAAASYAGFAGHRVASMPESAAVAASQHRQWHPRPRPLVSEAPLLPNVPLPPPGTAVDLSHRHVIPCTWL
jgi:hypothetical protein